MARGRCRQPHRRRTAVSTARPIERWPFERQTEQRSLGMQECPDGECGRWGAPAEGSRAGRRVGRQARDATGRDRTGRGRGRGHHSCCSGKRAQCVHASLHWTASGAKHRSRVSPTIAHESASSARAERAATARDGRDGSWRAVVLSRAARAPRHPLLQIVAACACASMRSSASPQRFEFGWQRRAAAAGKGGPWRG